jgi:hypothetical protein
VTCLLVIMLLFIIVELHDDFCIECLAMCWGWCFYACIVLINEMCVLVAGSMKDPL